jgi:hypothetical protein
MADRRPDQGVLEDVPRGHGRQDLRQGWVGQDFGRTGRAVPYGSGESLIGYRKDPRSGSDVDRAPLGQVSRGKLFATITADPLVAPRPFVAFLDNPEAYRSRSTVDDLNAKIRQSKAVGAIVTHRDREMGLNDEWLSKVSSDVTGFLGRRKKVTDIEFLLSQVIKRDEPSSAVMGSLADAPSSVKMPGVLKGVGSNWNDVGF